MGTSMEPAREAGFSLVELLVVCVLLGVLVTIAIPVYLAQRERAWDATTQSDLRNAKVALETYFSVHGAYQPDALVPTMYGYVPSDEVTLETSSLNGGDDYCLAGRYASSGNWYSIQAGGGAVEGPHDNNAC